MTKQFGPELLYDHHLSAARLFWMGVAEQLPAAPGVIHTHNGLEIHLTLSGLFEFRFGQQSIRVAKGEAMLCGMWEPHRVDLTGQEGNSGVAIVFLPEFLASSARDAAPWMRLFTASPRDRPRVRRAGTRESVQAICRHLQDEMMGKRSRWDEMVRLDVLRLLLILEREWQLPRGKQEGAETYPGDFARIMPAVSRVHANLGHRVTCAEAAAECGFSEPHFRALFRRVLGVGFGQFGLRARLGFAAHCLTVTGLPVREIAEATAFGDLSHFYRLFEKYFGCTPTQYRRQSRDGRVSDLEPRRRRPRREASRPAVYQSSPSSQRGPRGWEQVEAD